MAVDFLTSEWAEGLEQTVNDHEGFTNAISNVEMTLQFVVKDVPDREGDYKYHIKLDKGSATVVEGEAEKADVTITNGYDTARGISKGEVNTQMAFMTGKLQVQGDLAKLMMHQAALNQFAQAASRLDVAYDE